MRSFDPNVETKFVGDAIRAICKAAGPDVPVIGFAAAPWTLACYMIEGRTRGDISRAKQMLHEQPQVVRDLLDRIARATSSYLQSQIAAGASVIQLFDTWASELSPSEYHAFELPSTRMIFESLSASPVAKILFAKGSSQHLDSLAKSGADVLSVDWKTDLANARTRLGTAVALQGNVDPEILLKSEEEVRRAATEAVAKTGGIGPHPQSRPRHLARHSCSKRQSFRRSRPRGPGTRARGRCKRARPKRCKMISIAL